MIIKPQQTTVDKTYNGEIKADTLGFYSVNHLILHNDSITIIGNKLKEGSTNKIIYYLVNSLIYITIFIVALLIIVVMDLYVINNATNVYDAYKSGFTVWGLLELLIANGVAYFSSKYLSGKLLTKEYKKIISNHDIDGIRYKKVFTVYHIKIKLKNCAAEITLEGAPVWLINEFSERFEMEKCSWQAW